MPLPKIKQGWIAVGVMIGVELVGGLTLGENSAGLLGEGRRVYLANCVICHGEDGDGKGQGAAQLSVKPRDLRTGSFKFRSTPSGSLPQDDDLEKTLILGVRGTGMVPQRHLGRDGRRVVIAYIKTFSERFAKEQPQTPVAVPPPPPATPDVIEGGRRIYQKARCAECHGEGGRGDGPSAPTMKDDRGLPIVVPDFTRWPLKRRVEPEDLYRTIATGLNGTPMPSYSDALDPGEIWPLVRYLDSLTPPERRQPLDQLFPGEETVGQKIEEDARRTHAH
jgi:mono/diheme cytochrome c family protein